MLIFFIALGTLFSLLVIIYNKLVSAIERVNNNKNHIDIQLDRRYKIYESLVEVVKQYMNYEKTTLKDIVELRSQAKKAQEKGNEKERIKAEEEISKICNNINAIFEQYPDLKANKNALQLQEEIVHTENKLTFSKQAYNNSVENYKIIRNSFIESFVVNIFKSKFVKEFPYWGSSDEKRAQHEDYKVNII